MMQSPGVAQFAAIFSILQQRGPKPLKAGSAGPSWATASKCLLRLEDAARACPATVYTLSPSDASITLALSWFAQQLPNYGAPKRGIVPQSPNEAAVVLWIKIGHIRVLLGADLEESKIQTLGWKAIIQSTTRPDGRAQIFKVPHHGSKTADSPEVWSQMLDQTPYALLTPFAAGRRPVPSESDIARLLRRTQYLYCTARPDGRTPRRRPTAVEKTMNEVARNRRSIVGPMGHVQVRSRCGSPPDLAVGLFNGAYRIESSSA